MRIVRTPSNILGSDREGKLGRRLHFVEQVCPQRYVLEGLRQRLSALSTVLESDNSGIYNFDTFSARERYCILNRNNSRQGMIL